MSLSALCYSEPPLPPPLPANGAEIWVAAGPITQLVRGEDKLSKYPPYDSAWAVCGKDKLSKYPPYVYIAAPEYLKL